MYPITQKLLHSFIHSPANPEMKLILAVLVAVVGCDVLNECSQDDGVIHCEGIDFKAFGPASWKRLSVSCRVLDLRGAIGLHPNEFVCDGFKDVDLVLMVGCTFLHILVGLKFMLVLRTGSIVQGLHDSVLSRDD